MLWKKKGEVKLIEKFIDLDDISVNTMPKNETIVNNYTKAWYIINKDKYKKIMVSISGGADSDIILDICYRCDKYDKCEYIWFNTGLEYQATKDHLKYLENKYGIEIKAQKAIKPIPLTCKQYGQPFLSKNVSKYIAGLQRHNFKWEDETYEELQKKYPNCDSYLKWWCNKNTIKSLTVGYNKWLKEFLIEFPPTFAISDLCCKYAKKEVSKQCVKQNGYDLVVTGIRKAEGGVRSVQYKSCFMEDWEYDTYMPIFWYKKQDREQYEQYFDIIHSRCYTEYGFKRTGCACCPFGFYGGLKNELKVIKQYEPKLHKAICNVFKDSYQYTKEFEKFKKTKELLN